MSKKSATEILVHNTAPSRSKDDASYKALANAYHDFEPATRTSVFSKTISPDVVVHVRPQPGGNGSLGPSTQPNQIIRPSEVAGFVETPVLSWRDATNNLESPSLRMRHDEPSQHSQLSGQPPPSVVHDSLPDNNVALSQFCTPTRLLEDYLHPSDSSQSLSPATERASRGQQPTAAVIQSQHQRYSTFPTISQISQRRQLVAGEPRIALLPPDSSFQENSQEQAEEGDTQRTLSSPINTAKKPHVAAPSERDSSYRQGARRMSITKYPPRRQTPADPRAKALPLSPVVNANNKRRRPVQHGPSPSSRDSEFTIASLQPAAQEQGPPADTIICIEGLSNPFLSSSRTESVPPPIKCRRTSLKPAPAPAPLSRAATPASLTFLPAPSSSANPISSSGKPFVRSSSDIGPRQDAIKSNQIAQRSARLSSVLELYSPCPPTSDHEFDLSSAPALGNREGDAENDLSLMTPVLAKLAIDLNLPKRFQPSLRTRALRPYERGYWLVDCTSWDRELKESCWLFLADYLGSGAAGWGVWCTRDEGFTRLRMYCWGAVVGHLYLVLYIISKRKVLYTGTEWVDGDGEVVIRMEARSLSCDGHRGGRVGCEVGL